MSSFEQSLFTSDCIPPLLALVYGHFRVNESIQFIFSNPNSDELRGISLQLLNQLVDNEFGGRDKIRHYSIKQLRDEFVIPARGKAKGSYIDYLQQIPQYSHGIQQAHVFVSYNLDCPFLDMVDAFNRLYLEAEPDIVLFITVFCNNFNILAGTLSAGEVFPSIGVMTAHIVSLCCSFQRTVLVLCQWDDPFLTPVSRLWCLLELFIASQCQHRLDLALCADPMLLCSNQYSLDKNLIDSFSSSISLTNARIFSAEYRVGLTEFIANNIGLELFESTISAQIQEQKRSIESILERKKQEKLATSKGILVLDLDGTLFPADLLDFRSVDIEFLKQMTGVQTYEEARKLRSDFQVEYGKSLTLSSALISNNAVDTQSLFDYSSNMTTLPMPDYNNSSTYNNINMGTILREASISSFYSSSKGITPNLSAVPSRNTSNNNSKQLFDGEAFPYPPVVFREIPTRRSISAASVGAPVKKATAVKSNALLPSLRREVSIMDGYDLDDDSDNTEFSKISNNPTTSFATSIENTDTNTRDNDPPDANDLHLREISAAVVDEHIAPRAFFSSPAHNPSLSSIDGLNVPSSFANTTISVDKYYDFVDTHLDYSVIAENPALVQMLQRLQENYHLVLFSNSHYLHTQRCLTKLGFPTNQIFDAIFYADYSDVHFPVKPELAAYSRVETFLVHNGFVKESSNDNDYRNGIFEVLRKKIIFVDDTMSNVQSAIVAGWIKSFHLVHDSLSARTNVCDEHISILSSILDLETVLATMS